MRSLAAPRLLAAVIAARLARDASRVLGRGGGSTYPGLLAQRIAPQSLTTLAARLPGGSVVVAGTNGKTTTSRMLASILRYAGQRPIHNRTGANLLAGVASAVVTNTSLRGQPTGDIGLFEVDEASVPAVVRQVRPRVALLLNLFRDQLDRYGELDRLAAIWAESVLGPAGAGTAMINADDPGLAALGEAAPGRVVWFGLEDTAAGAGQLSHAADAIYCRCGRALCYDAVHYGHLGHWRCPGCGRRRPCPQVWAANLRQEGLDGTRFDLHWGEETLAITLPLPGLYNVLNATAAAAAAHVLGLPAAAVVQGLGSVAAAFGRLERLQVDGHAVILWLVKNPAGFNEALRTLLAQPGPKTLVIAINDRAADGHDVSWLWDVDVEMLAGASAPVQHVVCAGTRAYDMAVRLKYAGLTAERQSVRVPPLAALRQGLAHLAGDQPLYVFPTYTALLELREQLRREGHVGQLWED